MIRDPFVRWCGSRGRATSLSYPIPESLSFPEIPVLKMNSKRKAVRIKANQHTPAAFVSLLHFPGRCAEKFSRHQDLRAALNHWHRWSEIYPAMSIADHSGAIIVPIGSRVRFYKSIDGFIILLAGQIKPVFMQKDRKSWNPQPLPGKLNGYVRRALESWTS